MIFKLLVKLNMSFVNGDSTVDQNDIIRYNFGYHTLNGFNDSSFVSNDNNSRLGEEPHFWLNSPRCIDDTHDDTHEGSIVGPHQIYTPVVSYLTSSHDDADRLHLTYDCNFNSSVNDCQSTRDLSTNEQILADHLQQYHHNHTHSPPFVRVVKRRTTANKKERRRTQSINNAYADLRDCINVPVDTKLSKIKTLRLALSYISYLTGILGPKDDNVSVIGGPSPVHQRTSKQSSANNSRSGYLSEGSSSPAAHNDAFNNDEHYRRQQQQQELDVGTLKQSRAQRPQAKASKGRTGWPQHLWAMELKHQQSY